ncbi:S8 family serine peptidase [Frigoribacterium sp. CFBP 13729]|uniref:S8 family peptidase n=1 Tax=Frigoribacterium sp. CFBP 13729 TaxID=2775293 RepID=UPI00177B271E|nr:S8 family serine peptidase [Frigoribacterium sp. CFBP 13729]
MITSSGRRRPKAPLSALLISGLVAAGVVALPATSALAADGPAVVGDSQFASGSYIVTLREPAAATYEGGKAGFAATAAPEGARLDASAAPVQEWSEHLEQTQADVAGAVGATVDAHFSVTTNAFAADLSADQARALAADPSVAAVSKNELLKLQATPSTEFLGLGDAEGNGGVWDEIGGRDSAGDGVVVGIIDSGIAAGNASFAGDSLGEQDSAEPHLEGDSIVYDKGDGGTFTGVCQTGVQFTASDCNTKLVGARYFVDGFGVDNIGTEEQGEYLSPRDGNGHGSHTASTAAGNADVEVTIGDRDFGTISGVAPAAKIAAYKVCWDGPDRVATDDDGCATLDLVAAIEAAVTDGVDVINYSIGGGGATSTFSATDQAFLGAASAGVFVAASAGNDGPTPTTADNAAPWITTVAASTVPSYAATALTGDGASYLGGSITVPTGAEGVSGPLVDAATLAVDGATAADAALCRPDSLDADAAAASGAIVLCDRGVYDRTAKSAEVERIGGVGMLLVNPAPSSVDLDEHVVPTVHVDAASYDALHAYAATEGATVTLVDGNPAGLPEPATPQIAGFSSRGPVTADGGNLLKPDISAPGVAILADGANAAGEPGSFEFLSGTSMSSPHVAGLAALYLSRTVHPDWTPAEVKSAMMTTAYDLVGADGAPTQDVFAQGAGHVDPTAFLDPGLLYRSGTADWQAYVDSIDTIEGTDSSLNLPSISVGSLAGTTTVTRSVTATSPGTWTAEPVTMAGVTAEVSPSTLTFGEAGETQDYTVTFTRTTAALDEFATGYLTWTDGTRDARSPLAVRPVQLDVAAEFAGEGVTGEATVDVTAGDALSLPLAAEGLALGQVATGSGTAGADAAQVPLTVAEGTTHARFVLDSAEDTADLDLLLYTADASGQPDELVGAAATGSADEQLDVETPAAGQYVLLVDFYSGAGDLGWTLTSYLLDPAAAQGGLVVDPAVLEAGLGETTTATASWSDLVYESSYLGRVVYGDTGTASYLTVTTGEEPETPVDPGPGPGEPGGPGHGGPGHGGFDLPGLIGWIWGAIGDLFHHWFPGLPWR